MSLSRYMLVLTCVVLFVPGSAMAEEAAPQPFELVRALRSLQDLAASGNTAAPAQQRKLIGQIADQLVSADPAVWSEPKNVRAAVTYVLSGGEPRVLRALFNLRSLPGVDDKLLNGALAYGEGRNGDALELLSGIDPRLLDPGLGAQVALVTSALLGSNDPKRARALLDDARILAPGTLIEEAALRREVYVVASLANIESFELLASQYIRRFANSVYAGSFRDQFATAVVRFDYGKDTTLQARLASLIEDTDRTGQLASYLSVAHEAVTKGRVALAKFAARKAGDLSPADSTDRERSRLYEAAVLVVAADRDEGVTALKGLMRAKLDDRDQELADAALEVGTQVRRWPTLAEAGPVPSSGPVEEAAQPGSSRLSATLKSAGDVLAKVDALLKEATP